MLATLLLALATVEVRPVLDPAAPHFGTVELRGLDPACLDGTSPESLLRLWTAPSVVAARELPPVVGRYARDGDVLRFRPRFPLAAGLEFTAVADPSASEDGACPDREPLVVTFRMPVPEAVERTRVTAVEPSLDVVPENLLRVYVHFSAPMRERDVLDHVRLLDADGTEIPGAFVDVPEGLWDPDGTRLTLFFHPGRIKRNVGPNRALGPPLREGGRYRLEIGAGLEDVRGEPLERPHVASFSVGPPDRTPIGRDGWVVRAPRDPTDPLVVEFPEPLDGALAARLVGPPRRDGRPVPGGVRVADGGRRWTFTPHEPWSAGRYRIAVSPGLEDLAGNGLASRFEERDARGRDPDRGFELEFSVSGAGS